MCTSIYKYVFTMSPYMYVHVYMYTQYVYICIEVYICINLCSTNCVLRTKVFPLLISSNVVVCPCLCVHPLVHRAAVQSLTAHKLTQKYLLQQSGKRVLI